MGRRIRSSSAARRAPHPDHSLLPPTMVHHILVGSYTDTIVTLAFDAEKGTLEQIGATKAGDRPSWLASYPGDDTLICAALEGEDGQVAAFRYDRDKAQGTVIAQKSTGGQAPCALWVTKDEIFASNVRAPLSLTCQSPMASSVSPWRPCGPSYHARVTVLHRLSA